MLPRHFIGATTDSAQNMNFCDFVPTELYNFLNCVIMRLFFTHQRGGKCLLDEIKSLNRYARF